MTRRRIAILVGIAVAVALPVSAASAFWTGLGSTTNGTGASGAATVHRGSTPTASLTASSEVTVTWGSSALSSGLPASGYEVRRFDAATGVESATGPGCAGTVTSFTCSEDSVPDGEWRFSVTPVFASNWKGLEGERSGVVDVGPASVDLSARVFGASLPDSVTGSLSGFDPDVDLTYTLDGVATLTGSPTSVGPDGTATITSLDIPDLSEGPHTVRATVVHSDAATAPALDSAGTFAILAGTGVTSAGASAVVGDLGTAPVASVTGFGEGTSGTVDGEIHPADPVAFQAKADLSEAYDSVVAQSPATSVATPLGGTTLRPGVYDSPSGTFGIAGELTLDARGDPDAVFIFKTLSTLITAAGSGVELTNGAQACNVFWQVGSSATLGASSDLAGSVMARTAITVGDGVSVEGRLMAQDASVTLINDNITLTPCVEDNRNAAAVAILVDRTAPTVGTAVTPAPDAGGWNRTPVQIGVSGDDGNGSGIAYLKATVDGSDPRTSPTATVLDGAPFPISGSSSFRYYAADLAGNESAVLTLPVKIDAEPPVISLVEPVDVTGEVRMTGSATTLPEVFYAGETAGSFRLRVTVSDTTATPEAGPASGVVSLGASSLTNSPIGFTFDPLTVTSPSGGPYVTGPYQWQAFTTSSPKAVLTVTDVAGNFATARFGMTNGH